MDNPIFPTEVMIEIASWLPVKTLTRCQLVCKDWQSLFLSDYFTHVHSDRINVVKYFHNVQHKNNPQTRPAGFSLLHSCNGLLLLLDKAEKTYCVWNPATRRVLELPDPQVGIGCVFAFSFVPKSKSYRIVSLFSVEGKELECHVLTLGNTNNVWRRLLDFPYPPSSLENKRRERASLVASVGFVHCVLVTSVRGSESIGVDVVSLELETEKFYVTRLPMFLGQWKNNWDMDWDGKLAIVDIVGENMEVMRLEDCKKGRWSEQKKTIHLPFLKKNGDENISKVVIPLCAAKGEIWFWLKDVKIFTYAMESRTCRDFTQAPASYISIRMYSYRPSLVRFEGMVPDTKLETLRPRLGKK